MSFFEFLSKNCKPLNRKGFTLVELLAAILLLSIVAIAVMAIFHSSITNNQRAQLKNDAVNLAQSIIEEYRARDFTDLVNETGHSDRYEYIVEVSDYEGEMEIKEILITVMWEFRGTQSNVSLVTLISQ